MKALLHGDKVNAMLSQNKKSPYYICGALNYLCRPTEFEDLDPKTFYTQYEVVKQTARNNHALLQLSNNSFVHPSYEASNGTFRQGVRKREKILLPKILQYDFPVQLSLEVHFWMQQL